MGNYKLKKINKPTTFCTMCFNLGSEKFANMRNEQIRANFQNYYLEPLKNLCASFPNLVIFCDKETESFILKEKLMKQSIKLIVLENFRQLKRFKDETYYKYLTKNCLKIFPEYKNHHSLYSINPLETDLQAIYTLLVLSKVDIVQEVSEINPYNTDFFTWIDTGAFQHRYEKFWNKWNNSMNINTKLFKCCINTTPEFTNKNLKLLTIPDIVLNPCETIECIAPSFTIHKSKIRPFCKIYNKTIKNINKMNLPCTEQAVWTSMLKFGYKNLFYLVECNDYDSCIHLAMNCNNRYFIENNLTKHLRKIWSKFYSIKQEDSPNNTPHKVIQLLGTRIKLKINSKVIY